MDDAEVPKERAEVYKASEALGSELENICYARFYLPKKAIG